MSADPVVLILGAGPRIGASVASKFASSGYSVAVASRKGSDTKTTEGYLSLKADFNEPNSLPALFDRVKDVFHVAPSVVIYNAAALTKPENDSMFSIAAESVGSDLKVNTVSPYIAAQQALKGWESLPKEINKTFIYTGNIMNVSVVPVPLMLDLGMGKSAASYWIGAADAIYSGGNVRFFYASERHADGKFKGAALDGAAHGDFYLQLASRKQDVPWHATFVKDKGYVEFK